MYIKTHLIPNGDEWVTTLFLDDDTKVRAEISRGYRKAMEVAENWSKENGNCPNDKGYESLIQNGT